MTMTQKKPQSLHSKKTGRKNDSKENKDVYIRAACSIRYIYCRLCCCRTQNIVVLFVLSFLFCRAPCKRYFLSLLFCFVAFTVIVVTVYTYVYTNGRVNRKHGVTHSLCRIETGFCHCCALSCVVGCGYTCVYVTDFRFVRCITCTKWFVACFCRTVIGYFQPANDNKAFFCIFYVAFHQDNAICLGFLFLSVEMLTQVNCSFFISWNLPSSFCVR